MKLENTKEQSAEMWRAIDAVSKLDELRKNSRIYLIGIELEVTGKFYEIQIWPDKEHPHWADNGYGDTAAYVADGQTLWEAVDKAWKLVEGWNNV